MSEFQNDYIMRQIEDMVQIAAKALLGVRIASAEHTYVQETADRLLQTVDSGRINEAENELYALLEDSTMDHLLVGLVFYSYLRDKEDDFLTAHDFSRDETESGIRHLGAVYGIEEQIDMFLE